MCESQSHFDPLRHVPVFAVVFRCYRARWRFKEFAQHIAESCLITV